MQQAISEMAFHVTQFCRIRHRLAIKLPPVLLKKVYGALAMFSVPRKAIAKPTRFHTGSLNCQMSKLIVRHPLPTLAKHG